MPLVHGLVLENRILERCRFFHADQKVAERLRRLSPALKRQGVIFLIKLHPLKSCAGGKNSLDVREKPRPRKPSRVHESGHGAQLPGDPLPLEKYRLHPLVRSRKYFQFIVHGGNVGPIGNHRPEHDRRQSGEEDSSGNQARECPEDDTVIPAGKIYIYHTALPAPSAAARAAGQTVSGPSPLPEERTAAGDQTSMSNAVMPLSPSARLSRFG